MQDKDLMLALVSEELETLLNSVVSTVVDYFEEAVAD